MIDKNSTNDQSYVTGVKILDVEKRYRPGPKYYVYVIQVTWTNPTNVFIIYRRYAQFFDLQCKLLDLFAEAPSPSNNYNPRQRQIPFLPGKIFLGRSQIRQIALERKHALSIYCRTLIELPERISRSRPVLAFFQPLPTDVQNAAELIGKNIKLTTNDSTNISGPSELPTYRCVDNFTAVEKTEMSVKRNTLVQVVQRHLNGWWFVRNGDRTGFVPGAFLKSADHQREDKQEMPTPIKSLDEPYVVNQSYEAKSRDEISLTQGSFVTVLEKSYNGWWMVQFNKSAGHFPAVYLTSCKGLRLPEDVTEATTSPSNSFMQRLSSVTDYEQAGNHQSPDEVEPELYHVHTDFHDEMGDCVSLQRGDVVEIHEKHSSGWWLGRRLKDDFILTWIPAAFLQKEPISEKTSHAQFYSNMIVEEQPRGKESVSRETIYQNIGHQISETISYTDVLKKKQQPMARTVTPEPVIPPSNGNGQEPKRIAVRDLIKQFNRQ